MLSAVYLYIKNYNLMHLFYQLSLLNCPVPRTGTGNQTKNKSEDPIKKLIIYFVICKPVNSQLKIFSRSALV